MMEASDEEMNREARGAIKEEWVKQVYPVRKEDEMSFEDNIPSSSEHLRVPRVHFVTQKFTDNRLASSDMRPYDRESRSRRIDHLPMRDPPRDLARDIEEDIPHFERSYRSYGQPMERGRAFYRYLYTLSRFVSVSQIIKLFMLEMNIPDLINGIIGNINVQDTKTTKDRAMISVP